MTGLFGVLAKTEKGRRLLAGDLLNALPSTFPQSIQDWCLVGRVGLALHKPLVGGSLSNPSAGVTPAPLGFFYNEENETHSQNIGSQIRGLLSTSEPLTNDRHLANTSYAYWDGERLMLVRDKIGQASLYIGESPDFFGICSRLEPLLTDSNVRIRLDYESAYHYLAFGSAAPGRTMADSITCLQAGHQITWTLGSPLLRSRYFTPLRLASQKVADQALKDHIEAALDQAIQSRLRAKQAILLSAGVDSSYIAATAAEKFNGGPSDAYTVAFDLGPELDESADASKFAVRLGLRHNAVMLTSNDALSVMDEVLRLSAPSSTWTSITHYHLMRKIKADGYTSVISGLGSDEVFGGYSDFLEGYKRLRLFIDASGPGVPLDPFTTVLMNPALARQLLFAGIPRFFDDDSFRVSLEEPFLSWSYGTYLQDFYREARQIKPHAHLFEMMVAHECNQRIPELLLASFEQIGQGYGLTTEYPFLDEAVVGLACGLGASERFWLVKDHWNSKRTLREIAAKRLPKTLIDAPPRGYTAPMVLWMRRPEFRRSIMDRVRATRLWDAGLVKREYLQALETRIFGDLDGNEELAFRSVSQYWILLTLGAWYDRFVA